MAGGWWRVVCLQARQNDVQSLAEEMEDEVAAWHRSWHRLSWHRCQDHATGGDTDLGKLLRPHFERVLEIMVNKAPEGNHPLLWP